MIIAVVDRPARRPLSATAGFGVAALILFLVIDLPDVNELGDIEDPELRPRHAPRPNPQPGFWLEAVGAVVLGSASVAFATLGTEQLQSPRRWESRRRQADGEAPEKPRARNGTHRNRPQAAKSAQRPGTGEVQSALSRTQEPTPTTASAGAR